MRRGSPPPDNTIKGRNFKRKGGYPSPPNFPRSQLPQGQVGGEGGGGRLPVVFMRLLYLTRRALGLALGWARLAGRRTG